MSHLLRQLISLVSIKAGVLSRRFLGMSVKWGFCSIRVDLIKLPWYTHIKMYESSDYNQLRKNMIIVLACFTVAIYLIASIDNGFRYIAPIFPCFIGIVLFIDSLKDTPQSIKILRKVIFDRRVGLALGISMFVYMSLFIVDSLPWRGMRALGLIISIPTGLTCLYFWIKEKWNPY